MTVFDIAAQLAAVAPIGRDEAQRAAERELSKGVYHQNEPGPIDRAITAVTDWISRLLDRIVGSTPGGSLGVLVLLAIVVAVAALVIWRTGPVRRGARIGSPLVELSGDLDAAEHRRRAEEHAAAGRYAESIRERMRAIVSRIGEPRCARAATRAHGGRSGSRRRCGGAAVAGDLRTAAGVFDEIWYGGRPATAQADALMRQADERIRRRATGRRRCRPAGCRRVSGAAMSVQDAPPAPPPATAETVLDDPPANGAPTVSGASASTLWRQYRLVVVVVVVILVVAVAIGVARSRGAQGRLDPRSADPDGGRALATLLGDRGVHVDRVTDANALPAGLDSSDRRAGADPRPVGRQRGPGSR